MVGRWDKVKRDYMVGGEPSSQDIMLNCYSYK